MYALQGGLLKRFRVKKGEPGLVLLQVRMTPASKRELVRRAQRNRVSLAEFVRTMTRIELHDENPYSAESYLRMSAAEDRELERRERVRLR
jgi:hypothetical protein